MLGEKKEFLDYIKKNLEKNIKLIFIFKKITNNYKKKIC